LIIAIFFFCIAEKLPAQEVIGHFAMHLHPKPIGHAPKKYFPGITVQIH
jgi:hypothetical protein